MAGILIQLIGAAGLYILDAASFLFVAGTVFSLPHIVASSSNDSRLGIRKGVAHVIERRHLLVVLTLSIVLGSIGRNFQVAMAAFSSHLSNAGAIYGLLSAAFGVGAFIGAFAGSIIGKVRLPLLFIAASGAAAIQALTSLSSSVMVFAGALVIIAVGAVLTDTGISTAIQAGSDPDMRGRVVGLQGVSSGIAGAVGAPVVGLMTEALGVRFAMMINGSLTLVACVIGAAMVNKVKPWSLGVRWLKVRSSQRLAHKAAICCEPSTVFAEIRCAIWSKPRAVMDQ